jgi:hypothetical protein
VPSWAWTAFTLAPWAISRSGFDLRGFIASQVMIPLDLALQAGGRLVAGLDRLAAGTPYSVRDKPEPQIQSRTPRTSVVR